MLKGQPRYFEWRHCRYDGTFFDAAISLTAFLERGKPYILAICRDITENKRALEALHESEEKYRTLIENAGEAIVVTQDFKAVFLNPVMATITGYSDEELLSRPFVDFIHADDREMIIDNHIRRLNCENVPSRYSFRLLHKNDGFRWVELNAVRINWKGKPATLNFMIDITERKLSEEKAKESHALLRIAGEKAKLGGWIVNLEENRSIWSDEVAAIHEMPVGYSPLVEQGISFYTPQWQARITKVFTDCAQKGIPYDEEMEIITAGGRRVWVRTIGEAVKDDTGKIIKVHGAFQDITDRKQIELELRASESNYRNSFNDSPLGVRISTIEGETIYANRAILDIYGYNSVRDAATLDAARRTARGLAAGGARGARVKLGRHARVRAVGARQQRARQSSAGQPGRAAAVHARAVDLVRSLPGCAVRAARTHGRAPAPVHRQLERMRAQPRCQTAARRSRTRSDGPARPPAVAAGACATPARALEHAGAGVAGARVQPRARGVARRGERTQEIVR